MTITLINPNLVVQKSDPFTTGIVYMPIKLAYAASSLRENGCEVRVIDAFGENPKKVRKTKKFLFFGLDEADILERIPSDADVVCVYAINLTNHLSTLQIIRAVRQAYPEKTIIVLENSQAVTAYGLKVVSNEFYESGADYILTGEYEDTITGTIKQLNLSADPDVFKDTFGLGAKEFYQQPSYDLGGLDSMPFPAWDLFPLENYWKLRFAHGPLTQDRYLPLLTSRGCSFSCKFCVTPFVSRQHWHGRSAINVVDEIEYYVEQFQVKEFHIEDLNPTISEQRIQDICEEILKRKLDVVWKLVAGTKAETIQNLETIDLMAKAGCRYISISPETGSPELLQKMSKPFNLPHAVDLVRRMNHVGIRSQACFVLGFPGETQKDRELTKFLVHDLTREGIDEIALFIISPVPGAEIYEDFGGYQSLSELNFTPTWRRDYPELARFRRHLYGRFLWWKLKYHPLKILIQPFHFLRRRFFTKMEMVPYRAMILKMRGIRATQILVSEQGRDT